MFARHRQDLKEAHADVVKALERTIIVLSDEVDYLRAQLLGNVHIRNTATASSPHLGLPASEPGQKLYLSEEEEDVMALRLNDYLSDADMHDLEYALGVPLSVDNMPQLEADD